ncbi:MAG TPA: CBS domain-containing protein [Sedimentisphaerales bacterium]|nr:CBS domain-containing protein [Sedimentisphaerales bacterium]
MLIPMLKDIMTKDVVTVRTDTPIYEALELLAKYDISGLPVVEDDMTLIGILSEKDVITLVGAPEGDKEKTVDDFMTQPALYFDEEESFLDVCDFLKKNVFRRVPITSKGKLVGIVSIRDVIEFMLRLRGKIPASAYASHKQSS